MASQYDIQEVYYDKTNNQLVALFQNTDLWKYNLSSNTDQVVDLGTTQIRSLIVSDTKSYVAIWSSADNTYDIKEINLSTGSLTHVGNSSVLANYSDLYDMYYDQSNNQLVGLFQNLDLWKYNLGSNTDQVIDLPATLDYINLVVYINSCPSGVVDPGQFQQQDEIIKYMILSEMN